MNIHEHMAGAQSVYAFMSGMPQLRTRAEFDAGFRAQVEMEVERLIDLLDAIEPNADLEPYLAGTDGDDREADDEEAEPSLGWPAAGYPALGGCNDDWGCDLELDECDDEDAGDDEPWLAHPEDHPRPVCEYYTGRIMDIHGGDQDRTSFGRSDDREEEHDGREPEESGYGDEDGMVAEERGEYELGATEDINHEQAWETDSGIPWSVADGEPSLGWTGHGTGVSCDHESPRDDRESDAGDEGEMDDDREPSLGSLDNKVDQRAWSIGSTLSWDLEDEHDGREPCEGVESVRADRGARLFDNASAVFVSLKAGRTGVIAAWPR